MVAASFCGMSEGIWPNEVSWFIWFSEIDENIETRGHEPVFRLHRRYWDGASGSDSGVSRLVRPNVPFR